MPTLILVSATVAIISSLGAPLIPTIARSDGVSLSTAQWVLTAALLSGAVVTPILGRLSDGSHQRGVVLLCLTLVLAGCVLVGVDRSFAAVVIGRGIQGVGLGLQPVTMAIARRNLDHEPAQRAIATLSISNIIGVALGYPLTGFIADAFGFHGAYWFGAITIAVSLAMAAAVLPTTEGTTRRFDLSGAIVLALAIIGLSVYLSEGTTWGWTSGRSVGILAAAFACILWWLQHELRCDEPLIDVRQVRDRLVLTADVSGLLICIVMYLFLPVIVEFSQIPVRLGYGFGASIVVGGAGLTPLGIGTFFASRLRTTYERRFGVRTMIPLGSLAFAVAAAFFALEHRSLWEAFAAVGVAGIGAGFTFAAMPGLIVRAVPMSDTGSALGFYQVLRSIGLSIGSALSAAILGIYTTRGHTFPSVAGFRTALLVGAALCLTAAIVSYALPGRRADREEATPGRDALPVELEEEIAVQEPMI